MAKIDPGAGAGPSGLGEPHPDTAASEDELFVAVDESMLGRVIGGVVEEPATPPRPGLRDALVAFRYRNFSLFWWGALLSNTGSWVQNVTIPFVVFEITGSKALLGVASFLQFLPIVIMGPIGGWIADRFHRRSVLLVTQGVQAVIALVLWMAWVTDHRSIATIISLVALSGIVTGVNIPSWQAFVSELVPREVLLNAVTLNSTQFNAARAFGPAFGGLILGLFGVAWCFLFNAISYVAVIGALLLIVVPRLERAGSGQHPAIVRNFIDSLHYSRARPGIVVCFVVVVALGGLGSPMVQLFIVFTRDVFGVGDVAYGFLGAALGIGSILAAPIVAGRGSGWRRSQIVQVAFVAYGLAVIAFGVSPSYAPAFAALLVAGAGYLAIASTLNTTIQIQVDEVMRGKVIAVYIMFLTLALPIGSLVQGFVAQAFGPQVAVTLFGSLFLLVGAWLRFGTDLLVHVDDDRAVVAG